MGDVEKVLRLWQRNNWRYDPWLQVRKPKSSLLVRVKTGPVVLTAPHAVEHTRDDAAGEVSIKWADGGSGQLAEAIAAVSRNSVVTQLGFRPSDPVWHVGSSRFKEKVNAILQGRKMVIDLHIMSDKWGPDICLGLGPNPDFDDLEFAKWCADVATDLGFVVRVNWPWAAPARTLTGFIQSQSGRAMQIEVAARHRSHDGAKAGELVQWLLQVVEHAASRELTVGGACL